MHKNSLAFQAHFARRILPLLAPHSVNWYKWTALLEEAEADLAAERAMRERIREEAERLAKAA